MTSVHSVTRPAAPGRAAVDDLVVEVPVASPPTERSSAERAPAHAAPRPVPSAQRLRREKFVVVLVLVAVLAATLVVLAMQWLDAAPATAA